MKRTQAITALLGLLVGTLLLLAPAASAQTGYPIGPCRPLDGFQDLGSFAVSQRLVAQLTPVCVWTPGAGISVTVNGVTIPFKVANSNGFVIVDLTAISPTQFSVDDPVLTPARCGPGNTIVGRGPSTVAGGATVTQTAVVNLICPGTTPTTVRPIAPIAPAKPTTGRLSLTGSNTLRWAAIAAVLLAVGSLFVVATRRRASTRA